MVMQDMGVLADCEKAVKDSIAGLGGLDIIISNAVRYAKSSPAHCVCHTL